MALNDHVIIKRGEQMLIVQNYVPEHEPDMIFEPDDDFYRSISMLAATRATTVSTR